MAREAKKRKARSKEASSSTTRKKRKVVKPPTEPKIPSIPSEEMKFIGQPFDPDEAKSRWPHRYYSKKDEENVPVTKSDGSTEEKVLYQAKSHYSQAKIDGVVYDLFDDALFESPEDVPDPFVGNIEEMFETWSGEVYVCARWYYRARDTVMKARGDELIPKNRVFISDERNDNPLAVISRKVKIAKAGVDMSAAVKESLIKSSDFYYDMTYSFPFAFTSAYTDKSNETHSMSADDGKSVKDRQQSKPITVLDLYAGCGAMSSGLSLGARLSGVNMVTMWAVDSNSQACKSFKFNHPNTKVHEIDAQDFLELLKEWKNLYDEFISAKSNQIPSEANEEDSEVNESVESEVLIPSEPNEEDDKADDDEYEVEELLKICYGDPNEIGKSGVYFKVRWKGYDSNEDTWEPIQGLRQNCSEKIKEFVKEGVKNRLLPLPGDVDLICGGPPCQGISGFNRYRESDDPLKGEKNAQLVVFMDIFQFLVPRHVLMENVTDILKFAGGQLTSYAVGRLVSMNYQARLGIMPAGAYGVPQCRMRFFLWGAGPTESLPQFPLPTHKIMKKGVVINEFKECIVGHMNEHNELLDAVLLGDALSDLPEVKNYTVQDVMEYGGSHQTTFQKFIRLKKSDIFGYSENVSSEGLLYDHQPYKCSDDDYERICRIPKKKGANFRDLPGLIVENNVVSLDPSVEREYLKSGKPLVPDYALTFEDGKSIKPFGRLWSDEIVGTVVGRPEPHNQAIIHWNQDRVLSVRENARLQGFPDCYKLFGSIKERYTQVGNAVSFSASIPLGFCYAEAKKGGDCLTPLSLPFLFPDCYEKLGACRSGKSL